MQECLSINWPFAKYSLDKRVRVVNSNEVRIVKVSAPPQKNCWECSLEARMAKASCHQTSSKWEHTTSHPPTHWDVQCSLKMWLLGIALHIQLDLCQCCWERHYLYFANLLLMISALMFPQSSSGPESFLALFAWHWNPFQMVCLNVVL